MNQGRPVRIGVIASMKRGLEHFVYRELRAFEADGHSISLFTTKFARGLYNPRGGWRLHRWRPIPLLLSQVAALASHPVAYIRLLAVALRARAPIDFALAWHYASAMRQVDVIYATFADRKLYVGYFGKLITGRPLAATVHAYELYDNPNPRLFLPALRACDQVITVTEYNRELLVRRYGFDPDRVEVVRISVDVEDYRPSRKFVVLIVGYFVERKGHEVLFRALESLDLPDVEVWVVGGEGAERSIDVRRIAEEIGVSSRVAFFGALSGNALKAVYRACDVFCLPCRFDRAGVGEGFPTVIAEAMAFAKPVIATRHVEIPRVLEQILVEENDVDGVRQAIRQLHASARLREELGLRNRMTAEQLFSGANARRTASILRRLAAAQCTDRPPDRDRGTRAPFERARSASTKGA